MANTRIIQGSRGVNSKLLVHDGYRYQLNKPRTTSLYWRCWKKVCRSSLKTNVFNLNDPNAVINVLHNADAHVHPQEDVRIEEQSFVQRMKEEITNNPTVPVKRVYDNVVGQAHQNARQNIPAGAVALAPSIQQFQSVRSSLQRTRASQCPPLPANILGVEINGTWAETHLGERYLLHLDNNVGVAVFATDIELQILSNCRVIFVDGTFKTSPAPYAQVFSVHGEFMERVIGLSMALLTGKTQQHYELTFAILCQEMTRVTGNQITNIQLVVADFEAAIHNAVRVCIPNVRIGGCYFHFVQSLWRNTQDMGLTIPYRTNDDVKKCIRKCFSMGFLPLNIVVNAFYTYIASPLVVQLVAQYPPLRTWFTYINDTYIVGNFPPNTWNVFDRGIDVRTNNYVESYYGKWNKTVGVKHPSLWTTIRKMKDEQSVVRNKIARARQGEPGLPRRQKWIRLEQRINGLKVLLLNQERTIAQYWEAISYVVEHV